MPLRAAGRRARTCTGRVSLARRTFLTTGCADRDLPAVRDAVQLELDVAAAAVPDLVAADQDRVVRVVGPGHRLGRARGADEHRGVEAERVAVDVVVVVAPGAHLEPGAEGGVEQRRRARADPAGEGALRLGPAVDDRPALAIALGAGDRPDGLPEVERLARADDVAVDLRAGIQMFAPNPFFSLIGK